MTEAIAGKQAALQRLEASESEAQRISAAISAADAVPASAPASGGIMARINSLIDNDPELTRRNAISKTRDAIAGLSEREKICKGELAGVNRDVQAELDRFQTVKVCDGAAKGD